MDRPYGVARRSFAGLRFVFLLAALPLTACSPRGIVLDRDAGPPHTLVMISGSGLGFSSIVWDAGAATETTIPGGFLGAYMFSVPPTATLGAHMVAVQNAQGRSTPVSFLVKAPIAPFPRPRIDYVTLLGTRFDASGHVTTGLYVQGANFDVGAVVQIGMTAVVEGTEVTTFPDVATVSHKGLRTNWFGVPETELGYPIHHYVSTIAMPGVRTAGSTLTLQVRNLDNVTSEPFEYPLPANAAGVDSDGDGLLDAWEIQGYDANGDGVVDVNLPAMSVDPYRRDVLVEIDIMDNVVHKPDAAVFDGMRDVFRSAPIINPLSDSGINLILDTTGKPCLRDPRRVDVCSFQMIVFDTQVMIPLLGTAGEDPFGDGRVRFSELKRHNFDNATKDPIFHYAVWGIDLNMDSSGMSDFADDFAVTFDSFDASYQTRRSQVEQLVHELGHDLRQKHLGRLSDTETHGYLPNYLSVMSYLWDLRTGWPANADRVATPTCLPFYYASENADEVGGAVPATINGVPTGSYLVLDYSEGMGKALSRPALSAPPPAARICGKDVMMWDSLNLAPGVQTIEDFANWRDLKFDGPALNGWPLMDGILP